MKRFTFYCLLCVVALSFISGIHIPSAYAASYTATQTGNWDDPATWGGGGTPGASDNITIPIGIVVTIPVALNAASGTLTNNSGLVVNGILNQMSFFYNNAGASLVVNNTINNAGFFNNNAGATLTIAPGGSIYNNVGASLDNNGTLTVNGDIANEGTVINAASLDNNQFITNNGTFYNNPNGTLNNNDTIYNNGTFTNNTNSLLNNYNLIDNAGTLSNSGVIHNYCPGVITTNPVTGTPPVEHNCPTNTPTVTPTTCAISVTAPSLTSPVHRAHTTDTTPNFSWNQISGAQSYRLMIYTEDRSFEYKKRLVGQTKNTYTLTSAEALTTAKYLWRVRTQDTTCSTWTTWSGRNTLFVD